MDIKHQAGETKGEFLLMKDGVTRARLTYSKMGNSGIIIDHTEVSDELRGKNAGKKLVKTAIVHARDNSLKVIPLCPFAKSIIERDSSLQDVLK